MPKELRGEVVWTREHGDEIVIVHVGKDGPVQVARHQRTTPGNPRIDPAHLGHQPEGPLHRSPRPKTEVGAEFLGIRVGAQHWLKEASEAGALRARAKMARAVWLAKLLGREPVNWALGHAAEWQRFGEGTWSRSSNSTDAAAPSLSTEPARAPPCRGARLRGKGSADDPDHRIGAS